MAEISFGSNPQSFERFNTVFHGAAALLCLFMGAFALFHPEHYVFLPPVFIITTAVCGVNCYGGFVRVRHKKNRQARITAICYGLLTLIMAAVSYFGIRCCWM